MDCLKQPRKMDSTLCFEDNDDDEIEDLYANGKWVWDDTENELVFVKDNAINISAKMFKSRIIQGAVDFKHELDLMDEQRFNRKIQRHPEGPHDVVTLQDVKDIVLYTAPSNLLTLEVVGMLHTVTCERFLRALILYCQYYLQTVNVLKIRANDRLHMIATENSEKIEAKFKENLTDLRLLVSKEYCSMIIGAGDFKRFHHMGRFKKTQSQTLMELAIFEALIRMSVQIVWIALNRRCYSLLEVEINRLFRSKRFNLCEHNTGLDTETTFSDSQRRVLHGDCLQQDYLLNAHSPMFYDLNCSRSMDFRLFGLGIVKYDDLNRRQKYMLRYLTIPESKFRRFKMTLGIIGLERNRYDNMLKEIEKDDVTSRHSSISRRLSRGSKRSSRSRKSTEQSLTRQSVSQIHVGETLHLPGPSRCTQDLPSEFPTRRARQLVINNEQYQKWVAKVTALVKRRGF